MKTTIFIFIGSIMAFVYSCTNEQVRDSIENIRVIGHLEDASRTIFIQNDNLTDMHWVENDSIGLFTSAQQNLIYTALFSGKTTAFITQGSDLILDEKEKVTAYYPYTDSIKDNCVKLPVTTRMKNSEVPVPFIYGSSSVSNNELNFHFNHLYAYLLLTLSSKDFIDNAWVSEAYKEECGIYVHSSEYISTSDAWFNIDTNIISYDEKGASKNILYFCDDVDFNRIDTLRYMIPILPQAEGTRVSVNIFFPAQREGSIYSFGLIAKETPAGGFRAGHVYTINTVDDIKPSHEQFEILEDLYHSTNGHLWRNNKNWLTDKPLKEWYGLNNYGGINVVNNTYVNRINLSWNLLTGILPESFVKLMDSVENIDLSFNGMSGEIPETIKKHERWKELGWNFIQQDTRLSEGFNLNDCNLYLPSFKVFDLMNRCDINIKDVIQKNELTQIVFHYFDNIEQLKELFTEAHVNQHLDFRNKGYCTILIFITDLDSKIISESINEIYKNVENIYWTKRIEDIPDVSMAMGMSYVFNSERELMYFAPYHFESYIMNEYFRENNVVHQKYSLFLKSVLGDPDEHKEFKFGE